MKKASGFVMYNRKKFYYTIDITRNFHNPSQRLVALSIFTSVRFRRPGCEVDRTPKQIQQYSIHWPLDSYAQRGPVKEWEIFHFIVGNLLMPTIVAGGNRREDYE